MSLRRGGDGGAGVAVPAGRPRWIDQHDERGRVVRRRSLWGVLALALAFSAQIVVAGGVSASGSGIGIYPVKVELKDALRGAAYPTQTTIVNGEESDLTFGTLFDGEIAGWLSVRAVDDVKSPLTELVVPARSEARYVLLITVPATAENRRHTGTVMFRGRPSDAGTDNSGMGVSIGIRADVVVDVTGTQNLSGVVREVRIDDAEVGQPPVRLRTQFENNGNVQATPNIHWTIRDAAGKTVGEVSYDETPVEPGAIQSIASEWDMTGQPEGKYTASVTVSLADAAIFQREDTFALLPVGTLTRSGVLERIILEGKPQSGSVAKTVGVFTNNGQIDTRATFAAEVYRDGQLIQTVESHERVVTVGERALLEAFFEAKEAGAYAIHGKVIFDGRETEVQQLDFAVAAVGGTTQGDPARPASATAGSLMDLPVWVWAVGGFALLGIVAGLAFVLGRGRGRVPAGRSSGPEARPHAE